METNCPRIALKLGGTGLGQYVNDVRDAASTLIESIQREGIEIEALEKEVSRLEFQIKSLSDTMVFLNLNPDLDDDGIGTASKWEAKDKLNERDGHLQQIEDLVSSEEAREISRQVLAAGLLQIAKQGLSLVHGQASDWPLGRSVGSQPLRDVILESRNQAVHYEQENSHARVVDCFSALVQDFGARFVLSQGKCLAVEVVELLGWTELAGFQRDLISLGL